MLTFYPEFEAESPQEVEIVFLLDLSCSMKVSSIRCYKINKSLRVRPYNSMEII